MNDGANTQVFRQKNRKAGAGRLQSIRRIYRHSWKNGGSCCALENQETSKRAFAAMMGAFFGFSFTLNPSATKPGRSPCGTGEALTFKTSSRPRRNYARMNASFGRL